MNSTYSYEQKKTLANKIEKIKKKKYLLKIFKIIMELEKDKKFIENDNGIFMFFHNYKNETYDKINKYLSKIEKKNKLKEKKLSSEDSTSLSENKYLPYDNPILNLENNKNSIKLSNKEKNLIKRKAFNNKLQNSINNTIKVLNNKKSNNK